MRCPDQFEVGRRLERDIFGHWQLCGRVPISIAELAAGGAVHDHAVFGVTAGRIDVPTLGGRRHQHDASRRAGATQRDVGRANGSRTAGHLDANQRIHIDLVVGR